MKKHKYLVAITTTMMVFYSCNKEDSAEEILDDQSVEETVALESASEEVESIADQYAFYGGGFLDFGGASGKGFRDRSGFFTSCAEMVEETVDETVTTTITFPDDCTDRRGNEISGTITIVKSETETNKGRSVTFEDFSINGYIVNGSKTYDTIAANDNGNPEMTGACDMTIETDEGTITKSGSRSVEITEGGDTDTHSDDEMTITGSYAYSDADGNTFSVEITDALVKPVDCNYISSGTKQYSEYDEVSTLDYGDGDCDSEAVYTDADGSVTDIQLRRGRRGFRK